MQPYIIIFNLYIYIFNDEEEEEKTNISSMVVEGVFTTEKMEKRNLILDFSSTDFFKIFDSACILQI